METMTTKELLVQTLDQLSPADLRDFKLFIVAGKCLAPVSRRELDAANTEEVAELMEEMYRGGWVEETRRILVKVGRRDLEQRLSGVRENPSLIQRVGSMELVLELLLETLSALSDGQRSEFWERYLELEPSSLAADVMPPDVDLEITVISLVQNHSTQSVAVTKRVLEDIQQRGLVQRLSGPRSRSKETHDVRVSLLLHKAATMAAVNGLLLETLMALNPLDLVTFKIFLNFATFQKKCPQISWSNLKKATRKNTVNLMMSTYGQQSLEVTREVLVDMNRTDLLERLPEKSSEAEEKLSVDELWPGLIDMVQDMESVTELLLETVGDLSDEEQRFFITRLSQSQRDVADRLLAVKDLQPAVLVMVQLYGPQSVEATKRVLTMMSRTDLLQEILGFRIRDAKKPFVDKRSYAVVQKVALIAAFKLLLTDILSALNRTELEDFKKLLHSTFAVSRQNFLYPSMRLGFGPHFSNVANAMVEELGLQSVQVATEILMDINRSDLVKRLLEASSGLQGKVSADEYLRAVALNAVPAKIALKDTLVKLMMELGYSEIRKFKWLLQFTCFQKSLPEIPANVLWPVTRSGGATDSGQEGPSGLVDQMVQRLGPESVDVAREVLMDMNRTDVVRKLPGIQFGSKEELQSLLSQKEASLTTVMEKLLETFEDLGRGEFAHFQRVLQRSLSRKHQRGTPNFVRETGGKLKVAELMLEQFDEQTLDVAVPILKKIRRSDLVQKISGKTSAGSVTCWDAKGAKGVMQDSTCWTELEPELNQTDGGGAPIYSLQCEAGRFECSVSGLRWVCSGKAAFRYRFCSWDRHMDRMESRGFRPAGPLMDISLISGEMKEVFLPHWICIEDIPEPLEQFAVLHMDDCGDAVEKASEVSSSHVKLAEHIFSPRAVLMKVGFPVKIRCNTLIYRTNTAFLTLHVYLVPQDPALQQEMDRKKTAEGCKVIEKPNPERSLKMSDYFFLTSDLDAAEVCPKTGIKLRYPRGKPNFFEVYVKNADRNFSLMLRPDREDQAVWECAVRRGEYQSSGQAQELQCVDGNPMQRAATISSDKKMLLKLMKELKQEEMKEFKWHLKNLPEIPESSLGKADAPDLVDLMMKAYTQRAVDVTRDLFKEINRNDLVERIPA